MAGSMMAGKMPTSPAGARLAALLGTPSPRDQRRDAAPADLEPAISPTISREQVCPCQQGLPPPAAIQTDEGDCHNASRFLLCLIHVQGISTADDGREFLTAPSRLGDAPEPFQPHEPVATTSAQRDPSPRAVLARAHPPHEGRAPPLAVRDTNGDGGGTAANGGLPRAASVSRASAGGSDDGRAPWGSPGDARPCRPRTADRSGGYPTGHH
jgi:hypothetical protein